MMEYKRKRKPHHPGEILRELYLEPLHLTVTSLAKKLKVSRKTLSKIANGHGSITPEMAKRLSQAFGTTAKVWLNSQADYDLWCVENEISSWKAVEPVYTP